MPTHRGIFSSAFVVFDSFIFAASASTPFVHAFPYLGFIRTKYSNPASLPEGYSNSINLNSDKDTIAVSMEVTPYVAAYGWSYLGWGSRFSDPATLPAGVSDGVGWLASSVVAVAHSTAPYITVYPWSSGFGTKYANPATAVTTTGRDVVFNPAGDVIAVAMNSGAMPFNSYVWSSGFGTKYADPTGSAYNGKGLAFHPDGDAVAVASGSNGVGISAWAWSSGLGTKYSAPAVPNGDGYTVDFNPAGNTLITSLRQSPYLSAWAWTSASGFGTKYSAAVSYPFASTYQGKFNQADDAIAISSSIVRVYPFVVGTGFGTLQSTSGTTSGSTRGLSFI